MLGTTRRVWPVRQKPRALRDLHRANTTPHHLPRIFHLRHRNPKLLTRTSSAPQESIKTSGDVKDLDINRSAATSPVPRFLSILSPSITFSFSSLSRLPIYNMAPAAIVPEAQFKKDEKALCFHHELLYDAKVLEVKPMEGDDKKSGFQYKVHYKGWKNT